MPASLFDTLTADGRCRNGVIGADTARAARSLLRFRSLMPMMVAMVGASALNPSAAGQCRVLRRKREICPIIQFNQQAR